MYNKLMKHFLLFAFIVLSTFAVAQNKTGLKIYHNTDIFNVEYKHLSYAPRTTSEQKINFNRFSIAVDIPSRRFIHELEVFIPEISKSVERAQFPFDSQFMVSDEYDDSFYSFALRYEITKQITKDKSPFSFSVGVGLNPGFTVAIYERLTSFIYSSTDKTFSVSLNLIPRISYAISKKISLDLNVPLKVYDFRFLFREVENPNLPYRMQKQEESQHVFFEDVYTVRFGIQYRF
jgi:hypothetical protein